MSTEAYPLTWPVGWPRKKSHERTHGRFHGHRQVQRSYAPETSYRQKADLTLSQGLDRLFQELDRAGARHEVVSSNVTLRRDGLPRSGQRKPEDPGVAVYFTLRGKQRVFACDTYTEVAQNLAAIAKTIEALRAIDRYGVGSADQAFDGFLALETSAAKRDWRSVLGLGDAPTQDDIESRFRELAKKHHPDLGGDAVQFARINAARQLAIEEVA